MMARAITATSNPRTRIVMLGREACRNILGGAHLLASCAHLWLQPESSPQLWPRTGLLVLARPMDVLSCFSHRGAACCLPLSIAGPGGHTRCADCQDVPRSALSVHFQACQSTAIEYRSGWQIDRTLTMPLKVTH